MADEVTAADTGQKFTPHPEGQFVGQCVDIINLGERVEAYPGKPRRIVKKVALVFRTGELNDVGEPYDIAAEFTISMNEKAGLRAFLETWRGKSYTEEQAQAGVPLHKLASQFALLSVEHKVSGQGRKYGKIKSVSPVPKGLTTVDMTATYARQEWWEDKKKAYAAEVAKFAQEAGSENHDGYASPEPAAKDDDDLPF